MANSRSADKGLADDAPSQCSFYALRLALRKSGGIANGDDLARLLEDHCLGNYVSLARLIVDKQVFGFAFDALFWVPMFQFDVSDLSPRPAAKRVVAELAQVMDGWAISTWFARHNRRLDGRRPVDILNGAPNDVIAAAYGTRTSAVLAPSATRGLKELGLPVAP